MSATPGRYTRDDRIAETTVNAIALQPLAAYGA
jgi:hypothetical protein